MLFLSAVNHNLRKYKQQIQPQNGNPSLTETLALILGEIPMGNALIYKKSGPFLSISQ